MSDSRKTALRTEIAARGKTLPTGYRIRASQQICQTVLASQVYQQAKTLFCFVGCMDEPDTKTILQAAWADGKTVAVPRCQSKGIMDGIRIDSFEELTPGAYGILEPSPQGVVVPPSSLDLCLVPCVSCSLDGKRLGHGAGYYDRYLATIRPYKMLLCYARLISEEIPVDQHDIPMDAIVTEEGMYLQGHADVK